MNVNETTPFHFACMACVIAGFELPAGDLPNDQTDGFRMRFEAVPGADVSVAYEAESGEFLLFASFDPPKRRSPEEMFAFALKANHLRRDADPCFAIDPATAALTVTRTVAARDLDLADLAINLTEVTILAMKWRAMMDELPAERTPTGYEVMLRI